MQIKESAAISDMKQSMLETFMPATEANVKVLETKLAKAKEELLATDAKAREA